MTRVRIITALGIAILFMATVWRYAPVRPQAPIAAKTTCPANAICPHPNDCLSDGDPLKLHQYDCLPVPIRCCFDRFTTGNRVDAQGRLDARGGYVLDGRGRSVLASSR